MFDTGESTYYSTFEDWVEYTFPSGITPKEKSYCKMAWEASKEAAVAGHWMEIKHG